MINVICVLTYPEDGEQAKVRFIDLAQSSQFVQKLLSKAIKDPDKIETGSWDDYEKFTNEAVTVRPPVIVEDSVTIYFG